jgi:hypothetical protein
MNNTGITQRGNPLLGERGRGNTKRVGQPPTPSPVTFDPFFYKKLGLFDGGRVCK